MANSPPETTSTALETVRKVYLGSALALSGEHREAADILDGVSLDSLPEEWRGEAQWTLYVALDESGREARADSLLQALSQKAGEIGERARRTLER